MYEMIDLGTLGGASSQGLGIDNHGRVLGWSRNASGEGRIFLWEDGVLRDLGVDGVTDLSSIDMNRKGEIAGVSNAGGTRHAFHYAAGVVRHLGFRDAVAINDRGEILGFDQSAAAPYLPVVWENGTTRDLEPAGSYSRPRALNNRGEAVGEVGLPGGAQAIRWFADGSYEQAALPGALGCTAGAINDRGQAIGYCDTATEGPGFLWEDGVMLDLSVDPGPGHSVEPVAINERGQVAGLFAWNSLTRGFFWENGVWTDLGGLPGIVLPPGYGFNVYPRDLNDQGQVVGQITFTTGAPSHAFLWERGVMIDLGVGSAVGINRDGEIAGTASSHAVVWRPVRALGPAPSTIERSRMR